MVYAKYDLTFPVDLSLQLINEIRSAAAIHCRSSVLPCGHYSTGVAPFKYLDGWYLGKFLGDAGLTRDNEAVGPSAS